MIDGGIERTVAGDGVSLALVEAGAGDGPAIVFVHGYPDCKAVWTGMLAALAPRFHVAAYDVRGAGASSAPRGPRAYGFDELAADLRAVVDAVSPDAPVHVVGHDWGGIQGWELVVHPLLDGRLASFTTIAGPSLAQVGEALHQQWRRRRLLELAGRLRRSWYVIALCTPGLPSVWWRLIGRRAWPVYLGRVEGVPVDGAYPAPSLVEDAVHGVNLYRRNILWRLPRRRTPVEVRIPVQLIVPTRDRYISPTYYELAERYAPRLRRRAVDTSHWAPRTEPELLAGWVAEFVTELERDRAALKTA